MVIKKFPNGRPKVVILAVIGGIVVILVVVGIIVWQVVDWDKDEPRGSEDDYYLEPSPSELGVYSKGAVATDAPYCSEIGKSMLERGGSAVDAAIAAALCVGVVQAQSMGLGGGFFAVFYNASSKQARSLNARERAPYKATENMFDGDPEKSSRGALSIAVPGELKGYWELYKAHGKLPWPDLFQPTIELADKGYNVTTHAANALRSNSARILASPSLREVYVNNDTGRVFRAGDTITRPVLANTLRKIANSPDPEKDILYRDNDLMREFVDDIQNEGGLLTEEDMRNYTATWDEPVEVDIAGDFKIHSIPPPGSGILIGFLLRILSKYGIKSESVLTAQWIAEAFKHCYAKRTLLGDPEDLEVAQQVEELRRNLTESDDYLNSVLRLIHDDRTNNTFEYYGAEFYQPSDHGTSHISVISPSGDAIALTSTVNLFFGSMIRSKRTGIIYNDEMDDFSAPNITNSFGIPPSPSNFIRPHKRPVSSMAPTIFTDKDGKVRLIVGGSGGTRITTSVTAIAIKNLWLGQDIKSAIDAKRIHHQLYPMKLQYEEGFNMRIIEGLQEIGHEVDRVSSGASIVQGIAVSENGTIYANSDFRKRGTVAGF